MKPLYTWFGSKTRLLKNILPLVPEHYNKYCELFFGGGSLFYALEPKKALLNDQQPHIIYVLFFIEHYPTLFFDCLKKLETRLNKESYGQLRGIYNWYQWDLSIPEHFLWRTAIFFYLTKTGYMGYQESIHGTVCMSFKDRNYTRIVKKEIYDDIVKHLHANEIEISSCDYENLLEKCESGDFVYLDPPYHQTSQRYSKDRDFDQVRLASFYKKLHEKGCLVMLSNSDTPLIRELYKDFTISNLEIKYLGRKSAEEVVIINYNSNIISDAIKQSST